MYVWWFLVTFKTSYRYNKVLHMSTNKLMFSKVSIKMSTLFPDRIHGNEKSISKCVLFWEPMSTHVIIDLAELQKKREKKRCYLIDPINIFKKGRIKTIIVQMSSSPPQLFFFNFFSKSKVTLNEGRPYNHPLRRSI